MCWKRASDSTLHDREVERSGGRSPLLSKVILPSRYDKTVAEGGPAERNRQPATSRQKGNARRRSYST
jgi:hypothetical protein